LRRQGVRGGQVQRLERIMRAHGWRGAVPGRRGRSATPCPIRRPRGSRNLDVKRKFRAEAPGRLLVADFTYVPLAGGGLRLRGVRDRRLRRHDPRLGNAR